MNNKSAFYLIDDKYAGSGWDFDLRGLETGLPKSIYENKVLGNIGNGYPCVAKRNINPQNEGSVTLETIYELQSGNGFYIKFSDGDTELLKLLQYNGFMWAGETALFSLNLGHHYIKIKVDLDNKKAYIISDGKDVAECAFTGSGNVLSSLHFGYGGDSVGKAVVDNYVKLYKNYVFNDCNISDIEGDIPCEYRVETIGNANVKRIKYSAHKGNIFVYKIECGDNSKINISKAFDCKGGKLCYEVRYLQNYNTGGKISFCLMNGKECVLTLSDENCTVYNGNDVLKVHSENVWQHLRIEADTDKCKALVRLNGKYVGAIDFENNTKTIDCFAINFQCDTASESMFSDIKVHVIPEEPCDYVPAPVIPKKNCDNIVGMLMCSLWREGHHVGWDCITPFAEDHKPVLGWYDEGVAETADWEIKYMTEHGVDFALYCWFANENNKPIKSTNFSSAIHDGHMLAKYGDKLKMALLWEVQTALVPKDSECFRKYFVPYWIDHFFSDPRYMSIDNRAIMSIFRPDILVSCFGSPENVKTELDYLRKEVKKLGYDDLIIMACAPNKTIYKQCGFDAVHAYNWYQRGCELEYTKEQITNDIKLGNLHSVPTVSTGFNLVGWTGYRSPCMTSEDMKTALTWCRDEVLTKFEKDSWKSKLVMLSTWNEFGEGTYICPSKLNGFGYLDAIRSVFTEDVPHEDVVPNEKQRERIELLHVKDRRILAPLDLNPIDMGEHGVLKKYEFKTQEDLDKWEFHGITEMKIKDGRLFGHSDGEDPYMILKDDTFLPFSATRVQKIRANIRTYKPINQMCAVHATYSKRPDKEFEKRQMGCNSVPDRVAPLEISFRRIRDWKWEGTITAFRFDPVWAVGDFELQSIEFLDTGIKYDLVVDGTPVVLAQGVYEENGEFYIPFDTTSDLRTTSGIFYEWNAPKAQFVLKGTDEYVFTKDSDIVVCGDKQIKMSKSLSFSDGIPDIPAAILAEIMNRKLIVTDDTLEFIKH